MAEPKSGLLIDNQQLKWSAVHYSRRWGLGVMETITEFLVRKGCEDVFTNAGRAEKNFSEMIL